MYKYKFYEEVEKDLAKLDNNTNPNMIKDLKITEKLIF